MDADGGSCDQEVTEDLLRRVARDADLLTVGDEAQDVALDLHEDPFAPAVRKRALEFLRSPRYQAAAHDYGGRAREGSS